MTDLEDENNSLRTYQLVLAFCLTWFGKKYDSSSHWITETSLWISLRDLRGQKQCDFRFPRDAFVTKYRGTKNRVFRLTGFNVCRCQLSCGSEMNPNELPLSNGKWTHTAVILLPWSNFQTLHKPLDSLIGPSVWLIFLHLAVNSEISCLSFPYCLP